MSRMDLLLLVAEPLELALDLVVRLRVLGRFEGRLELLEALVQVALALRQLAEAVEHLVRLALLALALREPVLLGPALLLVAVLLVREFELLELPLRRPSRGAPAPAPLPRVADDLELAGPQLEQRLVGGLLGDQRRRQRRDLRRLGRLREARLGAVHGLRGLVERRLRGRVAQTLGELRGLLDGRVLRFLEGPGVLGERGGRLRPGLASDQSPGPVDDLLLELGQLVGLLGVLARLPFRLGRPARGGLALAEDLLEVADLGEEHVARRAPGPIVGADVLGPEEEGDELVGLGAERLEVDQVLRLRLPDRGLGVAQDDLARLAARGGVADAVPDHAEVVLDLRLELQLLDRGDADVATRLRHLHDRRAVPRDVDHELGGQLVGTTLPVHQADLIAPRFVELDRRAVGVRAVILRHQGDRLPLRVDQQRRGDVLVEPAK